MDRQIDMQELFRKKVEREEMRLAVYDTVLARIHKRIKLVAMQDGGTTFTTYILPEVMIGQPLFKQEQCRSFVMTSLVKNGFKVRYTHPNLLFISWEHLRPNYEKAHKVISDEQKQIMDKEQAIASEEALRHQQEHSKRIVMRDPSAPRDARNARNLVKAVEDYIPSAQLRNVYFKPRS